MWCGMITKEKIKELRKRMVDHRVMNDAAMVELSAHELKELLDIAEERIESKSFWADQFYKEGVSL